MPKLVILDPKEENYLHPKPNRQDNKTNKKIQRKNKNNKTHNTIAIIRARRGGGCRRCEQKG
jgi:hypothetical protein